MIKALWQRSQKCLGTFTMLLVEGSFETRLSIHLYNYLFGVRNFGKAKCMRPNFYSKIFKISARFPKWSKKFRKNFFFWDICIWIGILKLSLLITGYFSSAANQLTSSRKILHVNKKEFFKLIWLGNNHWI